MINYKHLKASDIGRKVMYRESEEGELSSWNSTYIFVRFDGPQGNACRPEDVSFSYSDAAMEGE